MNINTGNYHNKFVLHPKEDKNVTMTLRLEKQLQDRLNELSRLTNRSRNEIICLALKYALDNMEIAE